MDKGLRLETVGPNFVDRLECPQRSETRRRSGRLVAHPSNTTLNTVGSGQNPLRVNQCTRAEAATVFVVWKEER